MYMLRSKAEIDQTSKMSWQKAKSSLGQMSYIGFRPGKPTNCDRSNLGKTVKVMKVVSTNDWITVVYDNYLSCSYNVLIRLNISINLCTSEGIANNNWTFSLS